ncbi:MAG: formyltransferase family protein, partial [Candidatus Helarchaeota archaeon]
GKSPYTVAFLFSDRKNLERCKIKEIAEKNDIPYEINDIWDYYKSRGHETKRDMNIRAQYDSETVKMLKKHDIHAIALAGYMSIVTKEIYDFVPTINVHPADLTITEAGKRKFIGDNAVRDAILAGETHISSSTILVNEKVDGGPILFISKPLKIRLPQGVNVEYLKKPENKAILEEITDKNQDELKRVGDWIIFPKTMEYLARGLIEIDKNDKIFIDGKMAPIRL